MSVTPYLPEFENLRASTPALQQPSAPTQTEASLLARIAVLESQVQGLLAFQQRVIQGMPASTSANIPEPGRQSNLTEPVVPTPPERFVFPGFEDLASSPPSRTMPLESPVARQQADNTEQGPAMESSVGTFMLSFFHLLTLSKSSDVLPIIPGPEEDIVRDDMPTEAPGNLGTQPADDEESVTHAGGPASTPADGEEKMEIDSIDHPKGLEEVRSEREAPADMAMAPI